MTNDDPSIQTPVRCNAPVTVGGVPTHCVREEHDECACHWLVFDPPAQEAP